MGDWKTCRLGEILNFKRGYDLPHSARSPGPFPVVSSSGITDHHSEAKAKGPGVVTGRYGTLGQVFFVESDYWPLNTSLYVQDFKGNDPRFISYFLSTLNFDSQNAAGAVPGVNRNHLHTLEVLVPPLPIQKRIAGILSAYDELIENSQRRIKILETMARNLYREWFVHFRYPGHEAQRLVDSPLGKIPEGWEVKQIQHFGKVITGKTPSTANADLYGEDVPFVKTPDMHGKMFIINTNERLSIAGAESQANKTLPPGAICVSCIGTIGVVSITTENSQTNQQINSVVLDNEISREFVFFSLQEAKKTLENLGANGATMGNVNKGKFEGMELISPPKELLMDYNRITRPMFEEILIFSRQIQNLRRTRDLLLPRLLSGQIDVEALEEAAP